MRNYFVTALLLAVSFTLAANIPDGYYSGLDGKSKAELKNAAKLAAIDHTVIEYGNSTWEAFKKTDVKVVDGVEYWWDMYSNNLVKVSTGHNGLNIEHSVPNSWWGKTKNAAYKDLFHLNPSDAEANNRKSYYPLGIVATVKYDNGVTKVGRPASGDCDGSPWVFEPADCYKGDFARVYFYIFTVYDDLAWQYDADDRNFMFDGKAYPTLRPWAYKMLLEWSRLDPVDEKEKTRNEAVFTLQGNRNPFIDFPDLPEYIWGDKMGTPFYTNIDNGGGTDIVSITAADNHSLSAYDLPGGVNITATEGTTVMVCDAAGRIVETFVATGDDTFVALCKGFYVICAENVAKKVVIR